MSQHEPRVQWFWYVPSVLLILVTANQLRLVSTVSRTSWSIWWRP